MKNREPLITFGGVDVTALEDLMLMMAKTVENGLMSAGAEPGVDYTRKDLFELGNPFALEIFKAKKGNFHFPTES